jgi:tetratricopeptide (TPR) repeat protein
VRGILYQEKVPKHFKMPLTIEFLTNKRSFRRKIEVKGSKKKFSFDLERGENVLRVTIDPDFEVLGVRDVLEDRWEARSLRLEAAEEKNFRQLEPLLFSLSEKNPDNAHILHEVAQFYFAQQKWEKGIEIYKRILSLEPDDFTFIALGNIAAAHELMGDKKMQRFYLEKALATGSSMYSIVRSLMDKLEKLKEQEKLTQKS